MPLFRRWTVHDPSHFVGLLVASFVSLTCVYIFFLDPWEPDLWFHLHRLQDLEIQLRAGPLVALQLVFCLFVTRSCLEAYRLLCAEIVRTAAAFGALLYATSKSVRRRWPEGRKRCPEILPWASCWS